MQLMTLRPALGHIMAVLVVCIALLLQLVLIPFLGGDPQSSPFLLSFGAVLVAAWFGGLRSGLLATLLSTLAGAYVLISGDALRIGALAEDLRWLIFVSEGIVVSVLAEVMHSARRQAEAQALEVQRGEESMRLRAREQAAVAEFGQRALSGVALPELMDDAVRRVAGVLEAEYCTLLELRSGGERVLPRAVVGWKEDVVGRAPIEVGNCSCVRRALSSRKPVIFGPLRAGRCFGGSLLPEPGVLSGVGVTIEVGERPFGFLGAFTGQRRTFAEDDVNFLRSVANVLAATIERERAEERLRFLARSDDVLSASLNYRETIAGVARLAVPDLADWCLVDVLEDGGSFERLAVAHRDPKKASRARELRGRYTPDSAASGGVPKVLRTGRPEVLTKVTHDIIQTLTRDQEDLDLVRDLGITSVLIVPLLVAGETMGAITLVSAESSRRYEKAELEVAGELARRVALTIENARLCGRVQREIAKRERTEGALSLSERRFHALMQNSSDAISVLGAGGEILYQSSSAGPNLGGIAEDGVGKNIFDPTLVHLDDVDRTQELMIEATTNPGVNVKAEFRLRGVDGSWRHVEATAKNLLEDPAVGGIVITYRDVSERARSQQQIRDLNGELERRIEDRTARLAEANSELESFSYSVSHDLRAPLRHIDGYARMLQRRSGSSLDELGARYLETILSSVQHAGALVDDLLAFSRMGRTEMRRTVADMNKILNEARGDLQLEVEGREVVWKVGVLPEVLGDPSMLRLVLRNLLSNAVKYTRTRDRAVIEVGGAPGGREAVYFVKDNGVGFDVKYAEKIFGVFQRLHNSDEFEGTGIGLANVQRILNRHGGRIWAEGRENEGATFFFSLPRPLEADNG